MSNQSMTRREALALGGVANTLLLAACGGTAEAPEEEPTTEPVAEEEQAPESSSDDTVETSPSGKILVAFYSRADENYPGE